MGQWAAVLVNASGAIIARGRAVHVGPQKPLRSLRVIVVGELAVGTLRVGQAVRVRQTLRKEYAGSITAVGTSSTGALTVTMALDPHQPPSISG